MGYYSEVILGSTVIISAVIGAVRFQRILKSYRPFIYLIWLSVLNEIVSFLSSKFYRTNAPNSNIYVLIEFYLILLLFHAWLPGKKKVHIWLAVSLTSVWIIDNLFIHSILEFNSAFIILAGFVTVYFSINQINILLFSETRNLFTNSKFLICLTFLIYFSYSATVEVFYLIKIDFSEWFYHNLFLVLVFVNLFANIMYALATLWIPTKQKFTLLY